MGEKEIDSIDDKPDGKTAFESAARACREGGGKAGIALSDPFCVDRHRADFRNSGYRRSCWNCTIPAICLPCACAT